MANHTIISSYVKLRKSHCYKLIQNQRDTSTLRENEETEYANIWNAGKLDLSW